jgi:hypothetical protein
MGSVDSRQQKAEVQQGALVPMDVLSWQKVQRQGCNVLLADRPTQDVGLAAPTAGLRPTRPDMISACSVERDGGGVDAGPVCRS